MTPPVPPRSVLIRRTASRAHRKALTTLTRSMRSIRSAGRSATGEGRSTIPALLTSARMTPIRSTAANSESTSSSRDTSAWTDSDSTPSARHCAATDSAASARCW